MIRYRKVGGIHFLRIGHAQFMFCLCANRTRRNNARLLRDAWVTR